MVLRFSLGRGTALVFYGVCSAVFLSGWLGLFVVHSAVALTALAVMVLGGCGLLLDYARGGGF